MNNTPYWLLVEPIKGKRTSVIKDGQIAIIGAGFAGVSTAYWLLQNGYKDITIIDDGSTNAASYRNAGHILHGSGENYLTLRAVHGAKKAKRLIEISAEYCGLMKGFIDALGIDCDYSQRGSLELATTDHEAAELNDSVDLISLEVGDYAQKVIPQALKHCFNAKGGKVTKLSATAHPVKFRNGLLQYCLDKGVKYYSAKVTRVEEGEIIYEPSPSDFCKTALFDAVVLCANAYSPQVNEYFKSKRLIEPFRGQIMVSKPLESLKYRGAFSADHGYIYGNALPDGRLLIGGWRNMVPGNETGNYNLDINPAITEGLTNWVANHVVLNEIPEWEYEWSGIMGSSHNGLPIVGQIDGIYTCAGFTGYGFGWCFGSAKLLADIICGNPLMDGWQYFSPKSV